LEREVAELHNQVLLLLSDLCCTGRKKLEKQLVGMHTALRCVVSHVQPCGVLSLRQCRLAAAVLFILSYLMTSRAWPPWLHKLDPGMLFNDSALQHMLRCFMKSVWGQPAAFRVLSAIETVDALSAAVCTDFIDTFTPVLVRAVKMQLSTCSESHIISLTSVCEDHIGLMHIFAAAETHLPWKQLAMRISVKTAAEIQALTNVLDMTVLQTLNIKKHSRKHGRVVAEVAVRQRFPQAKIGTDSLRMICDSSLEDLVAITAKIDEAIEKN
jgi:hypothetical protein